MISPARIAAFLVVLASFSSLAAAKEPPPPVEVKLVADGLTAPISLVTPPDDSGRRFVGDQQGTVHVIAVDGVRLPTPFLDLRDRLVRLLPAFDERGLWSLAFHPEFTTNGRFS